MFDGLLRVDGRDPRRVALRTFTTEITKTTESAKGMSMPMRQKSLRIGEFALIALAATMGLAASRQEAKPAPRATGDSIRNYSKIEVDTVVAAPLADAWHCWSTTEGSQSFFAPHTEIDARPGGPFEIWFNPTGKPGERGAEDLNVLSVLPGEMISFEWNAPPKFAHARPQKTWVVVTFTPVDDQHTRVRLVHLGWDEMKAKNPDHVKEWDDVKAYFETAWPMVLGWMKTRFEKGPRWDAQGDSLWQE